MTKLRYWLIPLMAVALMAQPTRANSAETWLESPDAATQHATDYTAFFDHPEAWRATAGKISVFLMTARYLLTTPEATVRQQLGSLRAYGVKLGVQVLAIPVDKKVCGNGIEGTTWPAEPAAYAKKFKEMGAKIDFFMLDGPLSSGYLYHGNGACNFSLEEAAHHLATAVGALHAAYPDAKFVDAESPTSLPPAQWQQTLTTWLKLFRQDTGVRLYGLAMDIVWSKPWLDAVRATAATLHSNGVQPGLFLTTTGQAPKNPADWVMLAKKNACAVARSNIGIDFMVVSNWNLPALKNLPESDPITLTGYTNWLVSGPQCGS